jgi:hypothetical protein
MATLALPTSAASSDPTRQAGGRQFLLSRRATSLELRGAAARGRRCCATVRERARRGAPTLAPLALRASISWALRDLRAPSSQQGTRMVPMSRSPPSASSCTGVASCSKRSRLLAALRERPTAWRAGSWVSRTLVTRRRRPCASSSGVEVLAWMFSISARPPRLVGHLAHQHRHLRRGPARRARAQRPLATALSLVGRLTRLRPRPFERRTSDAAASTPQAPDAPPPARLERALRPGCGARLGNFASLQLVEPQAVLGIGAAGRRPPARPPAASGRAAPRGKTDPLGFFVTMISLALKRPEQCGALRARRRAPDSAFSGHADRPAPCGAPVLRPCRSALEAAVGVGAAATTVAGKCRPTAHYSGASPRSAAANDGVAPRRADRPAARHARAAAWAL